jgi:hypothetical protein
MREIASSNSAIGCKEGIAWVMTVVSVAVSFAVTNSPPPETSARFMTVAGALNVTFTVRVMGGYELPAASASLRVQVSEITEHVQPVPLIAVAVSPLGRVSVTVIVPVVGALPALVTVSA